MNTIQSRVEAVYDPIIPRDLWDAVQGKLALREPQKRAPRSPALWLKPFLVCGHPMRGIDAKPPSRVRRSYFCGTTQQEGKDNATGCRWHRVEAKDLELLVDRYLAETQQKIQVLKASPLMGPSNFTPPSPRQARVNARPSQTPVGYRHLRPGPRTPSS